MQVSAAVAHAPWAEAIRDVGAALDALAPLDRLEAAHAVAATWQNSPVAEVHGAPDAGGWGALEVAAGHLPHSGDTPFPVESLGADQAPWLELASGGTLPTSSEPAATVGGDAWRRALEDRAETWNDWLHLGYLRWRAGDRGDAVAAFERSLELSDAPEARRALAASAASRGDTVGAAGHAVAALSAMPESRQLLVEALELLAAAGEWKQMLALIDRADAALRAIGRVRYWEVRSAIRTGAIGRAAAIIADGIEIPDVREGAELFDTLWAEWSAATEATDPIPAAWDFRMFAEG